MNLRQLRSIAEIMRQGSFAAAGDRIGLSHSAISVQMQQLENSLGLELFDRGSRPVLLTAEGMRIAQLAQEALDKVENIRLAAAGAQALGPISFGFIPTSVQYLLPRVLHELKRQFPDLQVKVKSGLSGELAAALSRRELDYALLTTPAAAIPELEIMPIASEPFYVIGPIGLEGIESEEELLRSMPYIAFNRRTWVGQHIAARLQQRGIHVSETIEIDSLEAIENLVADGFGVSIIPQRMHAEPGRQKLVRIPFGNPVDQRELALARHSGDPRPRLHGAIKAIFQNLPGS